MKISILDVLRRGRNSALLFLLVGTCLSSFTACGEGADDGRDVDVDVDVRKEDGDTTVVNTDPEKVTEVVFDTVTIHDTVVTKEIEPGSSPDEKFEGTVNSSLGHGTARSGSAELVSVRTARHNNFDRVVFEFSNAGLPDWTAKYVDEPVYECGSGNPHELNGDGALQVSMTNVNAHTTSGQSNIEGRLRMLNLPVVQQLLMTCDYEANVTWVVGVKSPNSYRIGQLESPPRLVLDIKN